MYDIICYGLNYIIMHLFWSPTEPVAPSSINFNWANCNTIDKPLGMMVFGQPVALNKELSCT